MNTNSFHLEKDGIEYAGLHLIIDLYHGIKLDNIDYMKEVFKNCIEVCGATLLGMDFHHFDENNGISGIAVLAESHISVHTWPEYNYAAFDIFMCGKADPMKAIEVLKKAFSSDTVYINKLLRGQGLTKKLNYEKKF